MPKQTPRITALIGSKGIGRDQVIAKEMVRARHALHKLGAEPVDIDTPRAGPHSTA